jgi:hypothetical protein
MTDKPTITDEDRAAAASGYFAWCSGNETIPNKMLAGRADDHSMVQAFARHRQAAFNAGLERAAELWEHHKYNSSFGEAIRAEKEKPQ